MSTAQTPISDMLVTVKSREVQRGLFAEMKGDRADASRHFLAAAHLELVLVDDYSQSEQDDLAFRSALSAASCFWRAGQIDQARTLLNEMIQQYPTKSALVQDTILELDRTCPK